MTDHEAFNERLTVFLMERTALHREDIAAVLLALRHFYELPHNVAEAKAIDKAGPDLLGEGNGLEE